MTGGGTFGRLAIVSGVLLATAAITAAIFWQARQAQLNEFRSRFERDAAPCAALLRQEADKSLLALKLLGWFFAAPEQVDQQGFHALAGVCLPERQELRALSWNPRVSAAQREAFEQTVRREGPGQFRIVERDAAGRSRAAGAREAYYPVRFIEPLRGNEAAVGFDVGSEALRRAALERARDTGEPAVTEPFQLVQHAGGPVGFLVFAPVYREGLPRGTVLERRAALAGFAVGIYEAQTLVAAALRGMEPAGLSLALLDASAAGGPQLMYGEQASGAGRSWKSLLFPAPPATTDAFTFGGRQWRVQMRAGPAYMARHCPLSYWLVWPAGLLLGWGTARYFGKVLSSREHLAQVVAERTAELGQAQERLRLVLDAIPVRVLWKDRDSVYLGCNRRFAEDMGLPAPEAIVGKTDFDLPSKEYAELFRGRDRQVLESGQPMLNYEQPRPTGDGRVLTLRQNKLPLRDARGEIIGVLSVYEDITEQKKAEAALRESEARYRAVVENSPDGMSVSIDYQLVYVNPTAVRLTGARGAAELLGHSMLEFVQEDDQPEVEQRVAKMLESGLPAPLIEGKLRRLDGTLIEAEFMGVPITYEGRRAILNSFRDMTEHRRRDRALRASEARYRQLHESIMDAFATVDLSGRITDCNATFRTLLGYELEETRALTYRDITPERWQALEADIIENQVLRRGYSDIYEKEYRRKDGTVLPVELRTVLLRDDAGVPYGLWTIMRDITQRQQAEAALRQSREQLRQRAEELETIMGCAPVALWVAHDPQCNRISGNRMANSFDETSPQANWSANLATSLRWFRDGRQLPPEELPMQRVVRSNTEIQNVELELVLPSGRRVSLLGSATPLRDAQGRVRGCVGAFLDNTERKRAEGLLAGEKRVLECIARGQPLPAVLNEICRFLEELSPGMMSSILLLDAEQSTLQPSAAPKLPEAWTRALTPLAIGPALGLCGPAAWSREQVVVPDIATDPRWTGSPDFCALALACGLRACWSTPILSAAGEPLGTFAMYYPEPRSPQPRDLELINQVAYLASIAIEHHRAAEGLRQAHAELEQRVRERTAELVQANQRLEELDRLKSQFLATMSHELRTPLNSIIGFTGILKEGLAGPVTAEQQKQLGMVLSSGKHLLCLINDLLDLSRIEAGKVELEAAAFNFLEVIEEVVQNLGPLAGQKPLRLVTDVLEPGLDMVGDRKRCYQILLNLANNAVKFTDRGEVKIAARIQGELLRVSVRDTGIGIKPEQLGMLFEAFRQLDGSAKRVYEGTGLGLHLCRRLLTLMQGEIRVESEFGKGSCFSFTLPRTPGGGPLCEPGKL